MGLEVLALDTRSSSSMGLAGGVVLGGALNVTPGWWWADPLAVLVILVYSVREARHAWRQAT